MNIRTFSKVSKSAKDKPVNYRRFSKLPKGVNPGLNIERPSAGTVFFASTRNNIDSMQKLFDKD